MPDHRQLGHRHRGRGAEVVSIGYRAELSDRGQCREFGRGVCQNSGDIQSCTIVRNEAGGGSSGGIYLAGGTVINCVVYYNVATSDADIHFAGGGECSYSCASNITPGNNGNIASAPRFETMGSGSGTNNYVAGNYTLSYSSPCRNKGLNDVSWMPTALDLDGNPRLDRTSGLVDMGCYELLPPPSGTVVSIR